MICRTAVRASRIMVSIGATWPSWFPSFSCDKDPERSLTLDLKHLICEADLPKKKEAYINRAHIALAKTRHPPANPPPQHAQPMPSVQATCLSSLGAAHTSKWSVMKYSILSHTERTAPKKPKTLLFKLSRLFLPIVRDVLGVGNVGEVDRGGGREMSLLVARMWSRRLVRMRRKRRAKAMAKKYPSQPKRRQRRVRWV